MKLLFVIIMVFSSSVFADIIIDTRKPIRDIDPHFWGANFLFWIDDDKSFADGTLEVFLKDCGITMFRYPGGTVADNFHWQTASLNCKGKFPYVDGDGTTDFDEFMAICKRTGIEPSLVVNTESWFAKNDIEGGIKEACAWVAYCKKKGYKVKYWEIGNETYWHPIISAKEYGKLVKRYSKAMKKIDPNILIGANGHWNVNFVGTKERIKDGKLDEIMALYKKIDTKEDNKAYKELLGKHVIKPTTTGSEKWWANVSKECARDIDIISIHWYFGPKSIKNLTRELKKVKKLVEAKNPRKKYLMYMSEYNLLGNYRDFGIKQAQYMVECFGRFLDAGVNIGAFWPMRMAGAYGKRSFMDKCGTKRNASVYFKETASRIKGKLLKCESSVYCYAAKNKNTVNIVIPGTDIKKETPLTITLKGKRIVAAQGTKIVADPKKKENIKTVPFDVKIVKRKASLNAKPKEVYFIKLTTK